MAVRSHYQTMRPRPLRGHIFLIAFNLEEILGGQTHQPGAKNVATKALGYCL